jgi:hypothetical protein
MSISKRKGFFKMFEKIGLFGDGIAPVAESYQFTAASPIGSVLVGNARPSPKYAVAGYDSAEIFLDVNGVGAYSAAGYVISVLHHNGYLYLMTYDGGLYRYPDGDPSKGENISFGCEYVSYYDDGIDMQTVLRSRDYINNPLRVVNGLISYLTYEEDYYDSFIFLNIYDPATRAYTQIDVTELNGLVGAADIAYGNDLYYLALDGKLYYSADIYDVESWTAVDDPFDGDDIYTMMFINGMLRVCGNNGLNYILSYGDVTQEPVYAATAVAVPRMLSYDGTRIWASADDTTLHVSDDDGETFDLVEGVAAYVVASTPNGVTMVWEYDDGFQYTDDGENFSPYTPPSSIYSFDFGLSAAGGNFYLYGSNSRVYVTDIADTSTDVVRLSQIWLPTNTVSCWIKVQ